MKDRMRNTKRKLCEWKEEDMMRAKKMYRQTLEEGAEHISIRQIAKFCNGPRGTLTRRVKLPSSGRKHRIGTKPALGWDLEKSKLKPLFR